MDRVTPVEKVTQLLTNLKREVEADGVAEAQTYGQFACFCRTTTETKSGSIKSGQATIDFESSAIEEKTAYKATKVSELLRRKAKSEELQKQLMDTQALLEKERHAYEVSDADITKAISALTSALASLSDSKPNSFLALHTSIEKSFAIAHSSTLIHPSNAIALKTLLQQKVDPANPEYTFHSQGVLDTISQLLSDFNSQKSAADAEWGKTDSAHKSAIASLDTEISTNKIAIGNLDLDIDKTSGDIAASRGNLMNAEAELKDDQTYLKDLTQLCETRAADWDQRSKQRADEVKVLTQVIDVLTNRVATQDVEVNKRALLQANLAARAKVTAVSVGTPSMLQVQDHVRLVKVVHHRDADFGTNSKLQRADKVKQYLTSESSRLGSVALSSVVAKLTLDPFGKVKEMIQKLLERLVAESTAEATKKGFCDEQLGKATLDRKHRFAEAQELSAVLAGLEVKHDQLVDEIESLTTTIADLKIGQRDATENREEEKTQTMKALRTAREGLAAVKEATGILRAFYRQAAKAKAFVQVSPVEADTAGPGFKGAYTGKQESSEGIIGLLMIIQSDFERSISTTMAEEKRAAEEFVEFDRQSQADISGKETKKTLNEQDLETTTSNIETKSTELRQTVGLLDSALRVLEDLKPTCIDLTQPYETRVQKREEELQALTRALCILDPACKK
jgi:hypothetical protein